MPLRIKNYESKWTIKNVLFQFLQFLSESQSISFNTWKKKLLHHRKEDLRDSRFFLILSKNGEFENVFKDQDSKSKCYENERYQVTSQ